MPEPLEGVLTSATQTALETTAFLFAEPYSADAAGGDAREAERACEAPPSFVATVAFHGPREGALTIECAARLLPVLAANILGDEEAPSEEVRRDALGELANIVCGNVLPALDAAGRYSLGPPCVSAASAASAAIGADAARVARSEMRVEGEKVVTALWIRPPGSTARSP